MQVHFLAHIDDNRSLLRCSASDVTRAALRPNDGEITPALAVYGAACMYSVLRTGCSLTLYSTTNPRMPLMAWRDLVPKNVPSSALLTSGTIVSRDWTVPLHESEWGDSSRDLSMWHRILCTPYNAALYGVDTGNLTPIVKSCSSQSRQFITGKEKRQPGRNLLPKEKLTALLW